MHKTITNIFSTNLNRFLQEAESFLLVQTKGGEYERRCDVVRPQYSYNSDSGVVEGNLTPEPRRRQMTS